MDDRGPLIVDCDICGEAMRLAGVVPKLGPHPELRSFKCDNCDHVRTVVADDDDLQDAG
jgi:hypothetical protein